MRDYGKVHTSFWSSATTRSMTEDARVLAIYLITSPHSTIAGVFRLPDGYVCEDLQWSAERVAKGFAELLAKGFANRCETTKWVCVCKHLEWNPPENPNQRKSAAKVVQSIPDECAWKLDFMRLSGGLLGLETPAEANPSETLPEPFLNQKQEQEQEQDKEYVSGKPTDKPETVRPVGLPCPKDKLADRYHELLPMLPRIKAWPNTRVAACRSRWSEMLREKRWQTAEEGVSWFAEFFAHAAKSDFLTGRKAVSGQHSGWMADFDFLLSPKGFTGVREGKYDNHEATA